MHRMCGILQGLVTPTAAAGDGEAPRLIWPQQGPLPGGPLPLPGMQGDPVMTWPPPPQLTHQHQHHQQQPPPVLQHSSAARWPAVLNADANAQPQFMINRAQSIAGPAGEPCYPCNVGLPLSPGVSQTPKRANALAKTSLGRITGSCSI